MLFFDLLPMSFCFFFFNDTATTEIYTLSLHDALPIYPGKGHGGADRRFRQALRRQGERLADRKSTRLNSSHSQISYAVFCLKKKKKADRVLPHRLRTCYGLAVYVGASLPLLLRRHDRL